MEQESADGPLVPRGVLAMSAQRLIPKRKPSSYVGSPAHLAWRRAYYRRNRQALLEKNRRYQLAHREARNAYSLGHYYAFRHRYLEYSKDYRARNREARLAWFREYYRKHRKKVKAGIKRWRDANPQRWKEITAGNDKKSVLNLTPRYLRSLCRDRAKRMGLPSAAFYEMSNALREHLKVKRLLMEI